MKKIEKEILDMNNLKRKLAEYTSALCLWLGAHSPSL